MLSMRPVILRVNNKLLRPSPIVDGGSCYFGLEKRKWSIISCFTSTSTSTSICCCYSSSNNNHHHHYYYSRYYSSTPTRNNNFLKFDGEGRERLSRRRVVSVGFFNQGPGPGGGWKVDSNNRGRVLGNLALAIALTYLSFTGQLGWILDAIVSLWLFALIVPVIGLGGFLWWASRDILQGTCPNCNNDFQIFKSILGDESQICPYCNQPFSVVGDKFVQDDVNFSSQPKTFDQSFGDYFAPQSKKGNDSSIAVVDIEAEITDAD